MSRKIHLVLLLAALPLAMPAMAEDLKAIIRQAPIHSSLEQALHASHPGAPEPVLFRYMTSEQGVRLYRLEGLDSGRKDYVLVSADAPVRNATGRSVYNVAGGNTRCVVQLFDTSGFGNLIATTDLDWNNFGYVSGVNDKTSAIKTTCAGVWVYENKNYDAFGLFLYVPANTNLSSLTSSSMDNKISSLQHDLP